MLCMPGGALSASLALTLPFLRRATGDAVFGLAPGCLGHSVYAPAGLLAPMPRSLSFEAAATTPTVYVTVFTAFQQGRDMGPGTRVLVHAGTGGVGLAAIQVARALGCQVVASAGSPAKRCTLRRMGVAATADSRSTGFTDSQATATSGRGVDLLINSLTSPGELGSHKCWGAGQPLLAAQCATLQATHLLCRHGGCQPGQPVAGWALCRNQQTGHLVGCPHCPGAARCAAQSRGN